MSDAIDDVESSAADRRCCARCPRAPVTSRRGELLCRAHFDAARATVMMTVTAAPTDRGPK